MLMPTRFLYLRDVPSLPGAARQPVPEEFQAEGSDGGAYLSWLINEMKAIQEHFAEQMTDAVSQINRARWPSELGLSSSEFPFRIWRGTSRSVIRMEIKLYLGQVLENAAANSETKLEHSYITRIDAVSSDQIEVQLSGMSDRIPVPRGVLKESRGAGVLVPGPLKREQRCRHKIANDYKGREPSPAAASLVDVVRCAIAFDDPYAMGVMMAYLSKEFDIVRVKNRFESDDIEEVSLERMQSEFYAAENDTFSPSDSSSKGAEKMYRDILINLKPRGSDFICEVQLTLTGISILKKSEQKIYTLMRMTSATELVDTFVFSQHNVDKRENLAGVSWDEDTSTRALSKESKNSSTQVSSVGQILS
jgi:hypothetical protein